MKFGLFLEVLNVAFKDISDRASAFGHNGATEPVDVGAWGELFLGAWSKAISHCTNAIGLQGKLSSECDPRWLSYEVWDNGYDGRIQTKRKDQKAKQQQRQQQHEYQQDGGN